MSEEKVNHLFKAASLITRLEGNISNDVIKSYYLMHCPKLSANSILDGKRCTRCCLEFKRSDTCKVKSIKLSKKQKQGLKSHTDPNLKNKLRNSNRLEITCSFCGHVNSITVSKAYKINKEINNEKVLYKAKSNKVSISNTVKPREELKNNAMVKRKQEINKKVSNVYSKASEVFSMKNQDNKLTPTKETVQIKNNKKKKDKFAGLCQKAVAAAAKIKESKDKNNKLNLFLKPSSV